MPASEGGPISPISPTARISPSSPIAPLVVTLTLDGASQQCFDSLRRAHFPADRNHLGAHVTLFHALPGRRLDDIASTVRELAGATPAFDVAVTRVRPLGRGVAYDLSGLELTRLHGELARRWQPWLTRQDAQALKAHVTVQNKVAPEVARALHAELAAQFTPWSAGAVGLDVWWYEGGPWRHALTARFAVGEGTGAAADRGRAREIG